jgi:hypothetical protein
VATIRYTNEDDADSILGFQVPPATLYCRGQPASNRPEPDDCQAQLSHTPVKPPPNIELN